MIAKRGVKIRGKFFFILILMLLSSIGMIQCATKAQLVQEAEEEILKRRVQEYWAHRIKGGWDKSYLYELPEYREKVSVVRYINQFGRSPVKWVEFDILELWISGEKGYVKLNTIYRYQAPHFQKSPFQRESEEEWIRKDGQWYRVSSPV